MINCQMLQIIHQKSTNSQVYIRFPAGLMDTFYTQYPKEKSQIETQSNLLT